jgi:hypothetical protein
MALLVLAALALAACLVNTVARRCGGGLQRNGPGGCLHQRPAGSNPLSGE